MMEFVLTQSYATLEEMLNSAEVAVYKEELQQGNIEKYAIVSRIGNRYDLNGNKIEDFIDNPFIKEKSFVYDENTEDDCLEDVNDFEGNEEYDEDEEDDDEGEVIMNKYEIIKDAIEDLVDEEIEKVTNELIIKHKQEIAELKRVHEDELATAKANAKAEAKAELLAKLNG